MEFGEAGKLGAYVWETLRPDHTHPKCPEMVISALRERAAEAGHASAAFVDDWLPGWEQICSAN